MHVLLLPSGHFMTSRYPIGGIFQLQQANILHRAGYQVGVISAGVITPRFLLRRYDYERFERTNGYPVIRRYERSFYPHRWKMSATAARLYRRIGTELYRTYVRQFGRPDVVHAHNIEFGGIIAQAIRAGDGVPYIVTEHSSQHITDAPSQDRAALMASCAREAGVMTAVSRALADAITRRIGVDGIGIFPNVVDSFLLDSPLVETAGRGAGPGFLSIGSLDDNKNQAGLIEAFARRFAGTEASLRIGGTGPDARKLRVLAARRGVAGQVAFLGHLDRPAVLRELQTADCLVLPSFHETFGVVLIEALACGRPVIATRCGGPEDVVSPTTGLAVDPGDVDGLAEAMDQMARTRDRYRPESLRAECRERFGDEAFVARADRMYRVVRRDHPARSMPSPVGEYE